MSSSSAGKFQDHYSILGLNPKADREAIHAAYIQQAQKYSPDNPTTGSAEKFESVNLAYEVLSDPQTRAEFDKVKGIDQDEGPAQFSGLPFFRSIDRAVQVRSTLMCLLYDRRRLKPFRPALSMRDVEAILQISIEELTVALWYLKYRNLVTSDDKSSLQITPDGIDFLELNRPSPDAVLPLIRPSALVGATAAENRMKPESSFAAIPVPPVQEPETAEFADAEPEPEPAATEPTSILALLRRASGDRIDAIAKNASSR